MSRRARSVVPLLAAFGCALGGAVGYTAAMHPPLRNTASAARMPIPGQADVSLTPTSYGLYFGLRNAPSRVAMQVPPLDITIVPPHGVADPVFTRVPPDVNVYVDGFETSQVALIQPHAAGRYHVAVRCRDEAGGSFSIGEPPPEGNAGTAVVYAILFGLGGFVVVGGLALVVARQQAAALQRASES